MGWCFLVLAAVIVDGEVPQKPTVEVRMTNALGQPNVARPPARRPMDSIPPEFRPFLKYGLGVAVAAWFFGGIGLLAWLRWRQAKTDADKYLARKWITGLLIGVVLAVAILGGALWYSIVHQRMDFMWIAPIVLFLPPWLAGMWGKPPP